MKKNLLIILVVISVITSVISTYLLSRDIDDFPANLVLEYEQANSEVLTVYFDTGLGFQQNRRAFVPFPRSLGDDNSASQIDQADQMDQAAGKEKVSVSMPLRTVTRLRLDLDAKTNLTQSIYIQRLCLQSRNNQHCWTAKELHSALEPMNAISRAILVDNRLLVQANAYDPHFALNMNVAEAHEKVSGIAGFQYALFAVLLAIILFYVSKLLCFLVLPFLFRCFLVQSQRGFSISIGVFSALIALLAIVLSGAWLIAFNAGAVATWLFIGGLAALALMPTKAAGSLGDYWQARCKEFSSVWQKGELWKLCLITALCLLPIASFFMATWVQEFPHLGDHEYHLWGNRVSYQAVKYNEFVLWLGFLTLVFAYCLGWLRWALIVVAVFMVTAGVWHVFPAQIAENVQGIFSRYPGGARILASPFVYMSYEYQWSDPLNTGRVLNVLSVPMWLLVLRPLIIGRLPNVAILPFILIFFWQAEIVYLFSSAYLDIWSVIFILLAVEKLIVSHQSDHHGDDQGYLKSCLLLGVACAFKEPAVFIIPWFWLAGWSPAVVYVRLREQGMYGLSDRLYHATIIGFASVLPFLVYYVVRKSFGVSRYTVKGFEYFLTGDWFAEMASRIGFHFGTLGSVLLGLMALLWLVVLVSPIWKKQRWMMMCILGALLTQIFLFNWDQGGVAFTGYLRFYLPALVLFLAPVILVFVSRDGLGEKFHKAVVSICALAMLGNMPTMYASANLLKEPDTARSFNEHYDAPIYLPIRSLIKKAESEGVLEGENRAIHINHVTDWNQPAFVYSDLLVKYKLNMRKELACSCSAERPSVLAPFIVMSGLNEKYKHQTIEQISQVPQHQAKYVKRWREVNATKEMCLTEMQNTCQYVAIERLKNETVIGAIGVGSKQ
ncbi:MAG: hypothetical protein ACRBEE_13850 [Arenicella sp.]